MVASGGFEADLAVLEHMLGIITNGQAHIQGRPRPLAVPANAGENSLLLDRGDMDDRLPSSNIQVARECDRVVDTYLASLDKNDVVSTVREKLIERMPSGMVTEKNVAQGMNMSVRSLQRRFSEEGITFKQLLDDTRRELALQYVRDPSFTINEMTYLLGYSEPANFSIHHGVVAG